MGDSLLLQAFVYLAAAVIAVPIAKRLGLGSVLGYLIAGILIGPFVLGLVGEEGQDVMHFAEFGVVMMLFLVGLELQPSLLWRLRLPILGLGGLQVTVTTVVVMGIAMLFGFSWPVALAIGMVIALSSTAIVLQSLEEKNMMSSESGQSAFSVLLFQDIAVIPMLAIFPILATFVGADNHSENKQSESNSSNSHAADTSHDTTNGEHIVDAASHAHDAAHATTSLIATLPPWAQTLAVLGAVAAVILIGLYLSRPVFRTIARTGIRELFTASALLMVIGIALLMQLVGLSPALGTFLAGVVLANSEYRHELESDIEPFKGLLLGLFFMAVGASIDFNLLLNEPLLILGILLAMIIVKLVILLALGAIFKLNFDQNLFFAFSLAQVGEFAFVLMSSANQVGVLGTEITSPITAAVALSMGLTPLLMLLNEKLIQPRFGTVEKVEREADVIEEENPVIIAGFGDFGSIAGRLLMANNIGATVLDVNPDRVDVLRRIGLKVYYGDASRHDLLASAGAEKAKYIILALEGSEQKLSLVKTIKKHFPHLEIFARAENRRDAYRLHNAGVEHVYRQNLDTSLRMGEDVMTRLGFRAYQAKRSAQTFQKLDEQAMLELSQLRGDREVFINFARQSIADLEHVLRKDLDDQEVSNKERDAAWDTESLRKEFGNLT